MMFLIWREQPKSQLTGFVYYINDSLSFAIVHVSSAADRLCLLFVFLACRRSSSAIWRTPPPQAAWPAWASQVAWTNLGNRRTLPVRCAACYFLCDSGLYFVSLDLVSSGVNTPVIYHAQYIVCSKSQEVFSCDNVWIVYTTSKNGFFGSIVQFGQSILLDIKSS